MRMVIDLSRCQGYAQCVFLAPEDFTLTDEEALSYEPNPDDERRVKVQRAVAACPVQAIVIDYLDDLTDTDRRAAS
ncbi:ferredoxin [Kitasatospora sp. NPDC101155]|uniref:ferredoxin n=1 Tax=Kitasatospora sp. NPDC101155 TaxID=3364097 RepID=UPI0037FDAB73